MLALAASMPNDIAVMGEIERGGTIPEELVHAVDVPTLVLAGGASPDFFRDTTARITELLRDGAYRVLEGQDHQADAGVVAPVIAEFIGLGSPSEGM